METREGRSGGAGSSRVSLTLNRSNLVGIWRGMTVLPYAVPETPSHSEEQFSATGVAVAHYRRPVGRAHQIFRLMVMQCDG